MRGIDNLKPTGGGGSYTEGDGIDITNDAISVDTVFTEASTRTNINSGDTFSTILGKIKKWFTDLPSMFVSKSGDTMTGALTVNQGSETQAVFNRTYTGTSAVASTITIGNNIADGTTGSTYGRLRMWGKGVYRTDLQATTSTANRTIELPNRSGTIALFPTMTALFTDIGISLADSWEGLLDPTVNLNNYDYLGFCWSLDNNSYDSKKIQVIVKVSDFKNSTTSNPVVVVDNPWSNVNTNRVNVAWNSQDSLYIYRGSSVHSSHKLNVYGITF